MYGHFFSDFFFIESELCKFLNQDSQIRMQRSRQSQHRLMVD